MKTTIDIPDDELRDAMRFTRATTKREAVVKILAEFNRRRRMAELVKYSGTFSDRFPTNDEIEAIDAKRDRDVNARPRRLIVACAKLNGLDLAHDDSHFDELAKLEA